MPLAKVNGTEIFYQLTGEGEPVVLIPGLGTTHGFFAGVTPILSRTHQVVGLDLRGVGQSAKPTQTYTMELWADDIAALLDELQIARAHILGSSLGGCVAQVFADRHPGKTATLILAATFSEIDRMLELNYRVRMQVIELTGMSQMLADFAVCSLFGRSFYETEAGRAAAANTLKLIRSNEQAMYLEHLRAVLRFGRCEPGQENEPKFTTRLKNIKAPALVMCGDEDVLTVPKFSRIMADHLPNAQLVVQSASGHVNLIEKPQECAEIITRFLVDHPLS